MNILVSIIVIISCAPIVCMQLISLKVLRDDIRKEERIRSHKDALLIADRHYKNYIRNASYKVHQQMTITNESDIKW